MHADAHDVPIRLICFDLGGVIVRICRTWEEACAAAGLAVRHDDTFHAPDRLHQRRTLHHRHECGHVASADYWALMSRAIGGVYAPDEVELIHQSWILGEYRGIADLVERLASRSHIETACLSNTNQAHWRLLTGGPYHRAVSYLRHRIASHEINLAKPDEAAYRHVERLTARRAGEILFFDDMPENINAARAIGWRAELIDHTGDTAAQIDAHLRAHNVW